MEKIVLVDGNNLMFRSYYATSYTGNVMRNSKGQATNALYGFVNMINKIISEENPKYMMVAFDIGKNFRREKYNTYKAGRIETPEDLKSQFPYAKKLLDAMGIKYYELEPYEADDIIGTFSNLCNNNKDYDATIVSSDKDLLQLITNEVEVKLLKQKDHIRYNPINFKEDWGFEPIHIIDYKALAGDPSDNIPGVKGIGDKTAINLLKQYKDIEDIYEHINEIKGATQKKLIEDKKSAFISKEIATIYKEVPLDIDFNNIKYIGPNNKELYNLFEDLEFYSFIKNFEKPTEEVKKEILYKEIESIDELEESDIYSYYIECDKELYHDANIIGMAISTKDNNYYIKPSLIKEVMNKIDAKIKYTFDLKKNIALLNKLNIKINNTIFDTMIASYLLEENSKEDIAYLMHNYGINIEFLNYKKIEEYKKEDTILKSRFIYDTRDEYIKKLKLENMYELFSNIEFPLIEVLADMEITGILCNKNILDEMKIEIKKRIDDLEKEIYKKCEEEFNISSPRQLGVILFEKLKLPYAKKTKTGYSTDVDTLKKLINYHPVINDILEYRNISKLYTTYLEGLQEYIKNDGKIHTIYKQNLTRTGRLSSVEPNMQNIPSKDELGRKIKKAFYSENDCFLSCDYSQMELRLLAHMSKSKELQEAFIEEKDIHTSVAATINNIDESDVTSYQRKTAKAVVFGIIYGISGFGLGENLNITPKEAKKFIDAFYEKYPSVKKYLDGIIKEAYENKETRTLYNRKRTIEELNNKNYMIRQSGERIALNTPIQGTCADIIKKAMVDIYKEFKKQNIKSKMILQVHDELIFDCLNSEKELVSNIVKDKMENAIALDVPIKVSCDFGTNWYETK